MNKNYHITPILKRAAAALAATALLSSCAQMPQLSDLMKRQSEPKPEAQANAQSEASAESQVEAQAQAPDSRPAPSTPAKPSPLYAWNGNGRWVSHIEVDVDKQKARFFDGEHEIGWTTVASGIRSYPTPTGRFAVVEKVNEKKSNLYGKIYGKSGNVVKSNAKNGVDPIPPGGRFEGAAMPYFLRVTGDGIGLHAGHIPRPGSPASHGCIRMPIPFAPILYEHVKIGTSVSIVGSGPPYATYLAQVQHKAAMDARAKAKRTPAKPAEGQPATAAPTLAKTQPGGSSSAPDPDKAQVSPEVEAGPVTAAQASAKAPATLVKAEAAPGTTANTPPPAKEATAAATAGNAPAKTASTAPAAPATPPAKPDATAQAPATAKTSEPAPKSPTTQPDAAPAKTADITPAAPATPLAKPDAPAKTAAAAPTTPPAKPDNTAPAPATAKTSEPTPKAPAAQPASPPSPARTAPTPAVAGSTADHAPAVPQAPVNSPRATTQSAPEKEG